MADVVPFPGDTVADMPPEKVLRAAADGALSVAIVVGLDAAGDLYVASSQGDPDETIALLTRASAWLCRRIDEE